MIYQLPNGRVIHLSLEQYLDMSDEELHELACLGDAYTSDPVDPFYKSVAGRSSATPEIPEVEEEKEKKLDEFSTEEKLQDDYFHPDDV